MNDLEPGGKFTELGVVPEPEPEDNVWFDEQVGDEAIISLHHRALHQKKWVKLWPIALVLAGACAGYIVHPLIQFQPVAATVKSASEPAAANTLSPSTAAITVDVKGDVRHPGVYQLNANARVQDAIQAAGGFVHQRDVNLINMAAPVDDGTEVEVQSSTQTTTDVPTDSVNGASSAAPAQAVTSKLDLNQANAASLQTIPGIGPAKAAAIITYRDQHGPFGQVSALLQVPGIGPTTLARMQPYLSVSK